MLPQINIDQRNLSFKGALSRAITIQILNLASYVVAIGATVYVVRLAWNY